MAEFLGGTSFSATRCARLNQPRVRLDAEAALRKSSPSTWRHNGSGVERRGSRLLPSAASQSRAPASARTTGYVFQSRMIPAADLRMVAASATAKAGRTAQP